jgi:hypothetical protein
MPNIKEVGSEKGTFDSGFFAAYALKLMRESGGDFENLEMGQAEVYAARDAFLKNSTRTDFLEETDAAEFLLQLDVCDYYGEWTEQIRTPEILSERIGNCLAREGACGMMLLVMDDSNHWVSILTREENKILVYDPERAGGEPNAEWVETLTFATNVLKEKNGVSALIVPKKGSAQSTTLAGASNGIGIEIVSPTKNRNQYVNLDADEAHPEHGRVVRITAKVAPPKADKKVHWSIVDEDKNCPYRADLTAENQAHFAGDSAKKSDTSQTNAAGEASIDFSTSICGGDKFTVCASLDKTQSGDKTGELTVWRRLWYEVDTMKKRNSEEAFDLSAHRDVPALFKDMFLDWVYEEKQEHPDNIWNIKDGHCDEFADKYFDANKAPFQAHVLAVDHQATLTIEAETLWDADANPYVADLSFPYYIYDGGKSWVSKIEYNLWSAATGDDWRPLPLDRISLTGPDQKGLRALKIDFTGIANPTPANTIEVRTWPRMAEESGAFWLLGTPHIFVCMGHVQEIILKADLKKCVTGIIAHELAHVVAMVSTGSGGWTNPSYVKTEGGPHCRDPTCLMFEFRDQQVVFCGDCKRALRMTDIRKKTGNLLHTKRSA